MQHRCPSCERFYNIDITDLDLPEASRTQANFWKAKYFEMAKEVVKTNKGIRRLRRRLDNVRNTSYPYCHASCSPGDTHCWQCGKPLDEEVAE